MEKNRFAPTTINEYFHWLENTVRPETDLYQAAHSYMNAERERFQQEENTDQPFLSIITRTQGKRPDMLRETLLCLTAQSNVDFELLLMGHNLTDEQNRLVTEIVEELPEWMREKTRLIPVVGGTRSTPLNLGFEQANGKYIAVLDDDDIAFENWVEEFYQLSLKNKGKILHTYTVMQDWETVGDTIPRAAGSPSQMYCRDFKFWDELFVNTSPLCALAFPAYAFKELGIRFDETMTTTEDWDYLMRCAFLTGVANSSEVTFLYRHWLNAESSATVHSRAEWDSNYARIVENFVQTPMVMHSGALRGIIDRYATVKSEQVATNQEMFYDDGTGFNASKTLKVESCDNGSEYTSCFRLKEAKKLEAIRYDPEPCGNISVSDLSIRVLTEDGAEMIYTADDVKTNGCKDNGKLLFLKADPQIVVKFRQPVCVKSVEVNCKVVYALLDDEIEIIIRKEARKTTLLYRAARKCRHILRKVKNKIKRMCK